MKNVAVLTEDGAFALFFPPHPDNSRVPTPGNLPSEAKKCLCPGVSPEGGTGRRWNWLMHLTCCFLIFSLRCAKLVGSVAMQNSSWYGNDFAWKIDNLMQRATKWTFIVPGSSAEQQPAALIGWGEYIWTKTILCEPSIIYTGDSIQLVKDKDVSEQSGNSDTFPVHIHTCARAAVFERKSDLYSWPKQSSEGFLTLFASSKAE